MRTGLTPAQRLALTAVAAGGDDPSSTGDVAKEAGRDVRSMYSALAALERKGLVARGDRDGMWWWLLTDTGADRAVAEAERMMDAAQAGD